jgi:hypothetical protein
MGNLIIGVVFFVLGFAAGFISYAREVDNLTNQIDALTRENHILHDTIEGMRRL